MLVVHSNRHLCKPMINVVENIDMKYSAIFVDRRTYLFATNFVKLEMTQCTFFNVLICF